MAEVDRPDQPRETLRRAAHLYVDFCVQDPARTQLLFLRTIPGFEPAPESYALAQQVLGRLAEALAEAGVPEPADLDLWTAVLTGLATQQTSNDPGGDRWSRLVDTAVDRVLPA
ncbi:MAG: TetR-like C-terminal domain-containing protein [Nocardioides sp.]